MAEEAGAGAAPDDGPDEVRLGGKLYAVLKYRAMTSLNEHYVMKIMRDTGMDKRVHLGDGESAPAYAARLQAALVDTLRLHEILAGFLLPLGKTETDWSVKAARDTARELQLLQDPGDKQTVHDLSLRLVMGFFLAELNSVASSLSAFNARETSAAAPASP